MQKDITDVVVAAGAGGVAAGIKHCSQVGGVSSAIAELQGENDRGEGEYGLLENRARGWWEDLHWEGNE